MAVVTVAAIATTIITTLQDRKRSDKRLADERVQHDKELRAERTLADQRAAAEQEAAAARLKAQLEHSDDQIRQEREAAAARLQEERGLALKREQYEEAVSVQVTEARMSAETWGSRITTEPDQPIQCPAAIVSNAGRYTITRLQAQLCTNGNALTPYGRRELFSGLDSLAGQIAGGLAGEGKDIWGDTLRPNDAGMRFSSDAQTVRNLYGSYAIVRWRDRWGI